MNSLKKIAAISGILFALALLVAIIATPFAVSGGIDYYNSLIDEAEKQKDAHWFDTTVDSAVKELTIGETGFYGAISVQESPDGQIHLLNQDIGFSYIVPELSIRGDKAELNYGWHNDPKLTEENIMQWLSAQLYDTFYFHSVIQLPADVSLHFAEENMGDLYYNVRLDYDGFANYEELQTQLDGWSAMLEADDAYHNYQSAVLGRMNEVSSLRQDIAWSAERCSDVSRFQQDWTPTYVNIKELRSDMLKRSYNFRKEYSIQPAEELEAVYLEMNNVIVELCEYEKEYDLLTAKVAEAQVNLDNGNRTVNAQNLEKLAQASFDRQVELDLQIGKLREKLETYLREEFINLYGEESMQPGVVSPSPVPPTETTEAVDVPMTPETAEVPASPEMPVTEQTETVQA